MKFISLCTNFYQRRSLSSEDENLMFISSSGSSELETMENFSVSQGKYKWKIIKSVSFYTFYFSKFFLFSLREATLTRTVIREWDDLLAEKVLVRSGKSKEKFH